MKVEFCALILTPLASTAKSHDIFCIQYDIMPFFTFFIAQPYKPRYYIVCNKNMSQSITSGRRRLVRAHTSSGTSVQTVFCAALKLLLFFLFKYYNEKPQFQRSGPCKCKKKTVFLLHPFIILIVDAYK